MPHRDCRYYFMSTAFLRAAGMPFGLCHLTLDSMPFEHDPLRLANFTSMLNATATINHQWCLSTQQFTPILTSIPLSHDFCFRFYIGHFVLPHWWEMGNPLRFLYLTEFATLLCFPNFARGRLPVLHSEVCGTSGQTVGGGGKVQMMTRSRENF